jgi:hypothetical protein
LVHDWKARLGCDAGEGVGRSQSVIVVRDDLGVLVAKREISANIEHQESATKDLCFLVSILQVGAKVVSFSVSFPKSTLHALIAFLVLIPHRASVDG